MRRSFAEGLYDFFTQFGPVKEAVIMMDKNTGKPRGFGFVIFQKMSDAKKVSGKKHQLDNRLVDAKLAVSREDMADRQAAIQPRGDGSNQPPSKKVFLGGISFESTEETLRAYFSSFGDVDECTIMMDSNTGRSRGFGFVVFAEASQAEKALKDKDHSVDGKRIEVKRAEPKGTAALSKGGKGDSYGKGGWDSWWGDGWGWGGWGAAVHAVPSAAEFAEA